MMTFEEARENINTLLHDFDPANPDDGIAGSLKLAIRAIDGYSKIVKLLDDIQMYYSHGLASHIEYFQIAENRDSLARLVHPESHTEAHIEEIQAIKKFVIDIMIGIEESIVKKKHDVNVTFKNGQVFADHYQITGQLITGYDIIDINDEECKVLCSKPTFEEAIDWIAEQYC